MMLLPSSAVFSAFIVLNKFLISNQQLTIGLLVVSPFSGDNFSPYKRSHSKIDCEQSLFFFRFREGSARVHASGEPARREKRGRQPEKKTLFSCLGLAPSVTLVVICLSRAFWSTDQAKKERLRVVYSKMAF